MLRNENQNFMCFEAEKENLCDQLLQTNNKSILCYKYTILQTQLHTIMNINLLRIVSCFRFFCFFCCFLFTFGAFIIMYEHFLSLSILIHNFPFIDFYLISLTTNIYLTITIFIFMRDYKRQRLLIY